MNKHLIQVVLLTLSLTACAIYRVDVQQGNVIEREQLDIVEAGMTQKEVIRVLGNPLVTDPFHSNRWDYYYYLKDGETGSVKQYVATLFFQEGVLQRVQGDVPEELEEVEQ